MDDNRISSVLNTVKNKFGEVKDVTVSRQNQYKENITEKKKNNAVKKYSPIFREDVSNGELLLERVIRIVNYDARLENEFCKNSIGFWQKSKDRKMPTLYYKYVSSLGLTFYPQQSESVFISDPCIPGKFIEIDEYYNYMKRVRVDELTLVAQALGAKSVKIGLKSNSKSIFGKTSEFDAEANAVGNAKTKRNEQHKKSNSIDIWASTDFKTSVFNGSPTIPELMYFKNESDISALIQMVLVNKSKLTTRTYSMEASSSSGISISEAVSIMGVLKSIKSSAGAKFSKSAEKQSKSSLEYRIEF